MLLSVSILECGHTTHNGRKVPVKENQLATDAVLPCGSISWQPFGL